MKDLINNLDEKEAKSLLFQFFHLTKLVDERKGYSEEQFFLNIKNTYHDLLKLQKEPIRNVQKNYHATHIVFGDSPTGSLKIALKELDLSKIEKVITFSDLFSIGPIWNLHSEQGIAHRFEWIKKYLGMEDEELFNYARIFKRTILALEEIPSSQPILIWAGENAHEQTALRLALYLLKDKTNDIFLMQPDEIFKNRFTALHMGEFSSKQLQQFYEDKKNWHAFTQSERRLLEQEWADLCKEMWVLRRWDNNTVIHVTETFYDEFIINTVKRVQEEQNQHDFIIAPRLIGEIYGHLDQYVGDQFIEYRMIRLALDGVLDLDGIPRSMINYRVKIRGN